LTVVVLKGSLIWFVVVFAAVGVGWSAPAASPAADASASPGAKRCKPGFRPATIAGRRTCLKVGQRCRTSLDRQYHRYRLHCVRGRLARRHPLPPPPPPAADLSVTIAHSPAPVTVGQVVTYTIIVSNSGPNTASGVTLANTRPAGLTVTGISHVIGPPPAASGTCTSSPPVGCTFPLFPSGVTVPVQLSVRPASAGTLTINTTVSASTRDPNEANNSASASTTVVAPQCSDGADNDGDGRTDFPNDSGCTATTDETESPDAYACEPSYPTVCIRLRSEVGDLNCADIPFRRFLVRHDVTPADPHGFDGNNDGVGCET
jgi:uncharacterized repeat protein (TIGR01451 family)